MEGASLMGLSCRPLSRLKRGGAHEEDKDLPLFHQLKNASKDRMLYPFSAPNEIELSLVAAVSAKVRSPRVLGLTPKTLGNVMGEFLENEFDKTESDWLVTPPDSPLFPSLDSEPRGVKILLKRKSKNPSSPLSRMSRATLEKSNFQGRQIVLTRVGSEFGKVAGKRNRGNNEKLLEKRNVVKRPKSSKLATWK